MAQSNAPSFAVFTPANPHSPVFKSRDFSSAELEQLRAKMLEKGMKPPKEFNPHWRHEGVVVKLP